MSETKSRRIPKDPRERARDIAIGTVVGLAVLGFLLAAVSSMFRDVGGKGQAGLIIEKEIAPRSETQITVALPKVVDVKPADNIPSALGTQVTIPGGPLEKREIRGLYRFRLKLDDGRIYQVYVDEATYNRYKVGDRYYIVINPEIPTHIDPGAPAPAPDTRSRP